MSGKVKVSLVLCILLLYSFTASPQRDRPVGPKPQINRFDPAEGTAGCEVTIYGNNFSPDYTVWLGATKVDVISVTMQKIKVKIPPNAKTGRFVLRGKFLVESPTMFRVVEKRPAPIVDSFSPPSGPPGTRVTIYGANFSVKVYENSVIVGNVKAPIQSATPKELTVIVPDGAVTGKISVSVVGGGIATSESSFVVLTPLKIKDFTPKEGPYGTEITIYGTGFPSSMRKISVTMGGRKMRVAYISPDKIKVIVPQGAITAPLMITCKGKGKVTTKRSFVIKIPPKLRSFSPKEGFPGVVVSLHGENFGSSIFKTKVRLGGELVKILSITDNKIIVQVTREAKPGKFVVEVEGRGRSESKEVFNLWVPLAIKDFTPDRGQEGTIIKITGQGFIPDYRKVKVYLGGRSLKITAITPTTISAKVPNGAMSGVVAVEVHKRGRVETKKKFIVIRPPVIKGFKPTSAPMGQLITIYGKNFGYSTDDIRVWIGPEDKRQFCIVQQISNEKLTCQIQPNTLSGPVTIQVRDMGKVVTSKIFEIQQPLSIVSFSPASGMPGTSVTIHGTGFSPVRNNNVVRIGRTSVKVLSSTSHTLIVEIPKNLKSGGNFHVSVRGKKGKVMSAQPFNLIIPLKVYGISPKAGPIGTIVSIKGQGFGKDPRMIQVTLLGFYCPIASVSPGEVKVQIPYGLVPDKSIGKFQIIANPGGIAESPTPFRVTSKKGKPIPPPRQ